MKPNNQLLELHFGSDYYKIKEFEESILNAMKESNMQMPEGMKTAAEILDCIFVNLIVENDIISNDTLFALFEKTLKNNNA